MNLRYFWPIGGRCTSPLDPPMIHIIICTVNHIGVILALSVRQCEQRYMCAVLINNTFRGPGKSLRASLTIRPYSNILLIEQMPLICRYASSNTRSTECVSCFPYICDPPLHYPFKQIIRYFQKI